MPTRTKRTRMVGSLSSTEFTGYPWKYRGYGLWGGQTIELQYHGLLQFQDGNSGGSVGKGYCFNDMRMSSVTSLPSASSTGSVGTKTPCKNRARRGGVGMARGGAGVCVVRVGGDAISFARRDLRSSNFGTPAESSATFASASASR